MSIYKNRTHFNKSAPPVRFQKYNCLHIFDVKNQKKKRCAWFEVNVAFINATAPRKYNCLTKLLIIFKSLTDCFTPVYIWFSSKQKISSSSKTF